MRRGRRHPVRVIEGDALDFWRVEKFVPNRLLRLQAEMKVPGRAWLEFEVTERPDKSCSVRQTAIFDPVGLFGLIYWYSLYPLHEFVFNGMLNGLLQSAQERSLDCDLAQAEMLTNRQKTANGLDTMHVVNDDAPNRAPEEAVIAH